MTDTTQRLVAIAITGGLLLLILELVRRKRLMERYALLWLFATSVLLLLATWTGLLTKLSTLLGIKYPPSALFAVAFGFVLLLLLHFSLAVSRLSDQNKMLAQRIGLLQHRLDEHDRQLASLSADTDEELADEDDSASRERQLSRRA